MWVGITEVPTKHSIESRGLTKSVTQSLGIWGSIKHHNGYCSIIADTIYNSGLCLMQSQLTGRGPPLKTGYPQNHLQKHKQKSPGKRLTVRPERTESPQWALNVGTPRLPSSGPGIRHLWKSPFASLERNLSFLKTQLRLVFRALSPPLQYCSMSPRPPTHIQERYLCPSPTSPHPQPMAPGQTVMLG